MNFLELVKARYSVRNYEERPIEQNKLDYIMGNHSIFRLDTHVP